jgi:hypothetical protein
MQEREDTIFSSQDNPHIAYLSGNTWIATWVTFIDHPNPTGPGTAANGIKYSISHSGGAFWSAPRLLESDFFDGDEKNSGIHGGAHIATDHRGMVMVVFSRKTTRESQMWDVFCVISSNNGATWTKPRRISRTTVTNDVFNSTPRIATGGSGMWIAVWHSNDDYGGTYRDDFDIIYSRSVDNGLSWTVPAILNNNAVTDVGDDYFPEIAGDSKGNWSIVWSSQEDLNRYVATGTPFTKRVVSHDNGLTWSDVGMLNSDWEDRFVTAYNPKVVTDDEGTFLALWNYRMGIDDKLALSRSMDEGKTWSDRYFVTDIDNSEHLNNAEQIDLAYNGNRDWMIVGRTIARIEESFTDLSIATISSDGGLTWSVPQPFDIETEFGREPEVENMQVSGSPDGTWVTIWFEEFTQNFVTPYSYNIFSSTNVIHSGETSLIIR